MVLSKKISGWIKLIVAMAALVVFAFVILPLAQKIPLVNQITKSNRDKGIEAETLFYSETDEFQEATNFFNNSQDRLPKNTNQSNNTRKGNR